MAHDQSCPPPASPEHAAAEARNLTILALQSIVTRIGWIFKTESVIMPAFLDAISGAGWTRGCLPILSRFGQSVPPLMLANRLQQAPRKQRLLVMTAFHMAWPFLLLGGLWLTLTDRRQPWLAPLFLFLYFVFFAATGLNQLAFGTLQAKLIRPQRRGLLLALGGVFGSVGAVAAALIWLQPWLALPDAQGFSYIFLFNGVTFLAAGFVSLLCIEVADPPHQPTREVWWTPFAQAFEVYRHDRAFRRGARVAMLFMASLLLFPHYQWLAREKLHSAPTDLLIWVVAQNISVGVLSFILGLIADRAGNRLALRVAVLLTALTPIVALAFAEGYVPQPARWYWVTFAFLGLTPVTMKTFLNYTLELSPPDLHARYQSTMTVCFSLPFLVSPLFGWLIDILPLPAPFLGISAVVLVGAVLTFWMIEPRRGLATPTARPGAD